MVSKAKTPDKSENTTERLADFFRHAISLKSVKRAGWISKVNVKGAESVADHSYSMCMAGMVLADLQGLDAEKAMRMILLHDLPESATGDLMPGEVSKPQKAAAENRAMTEILSLLPEPLRARYAAIWNEYAEAKTELARFVHRIDKLEMGLQAREYEKQGYDRLALEEFHRSALDAVAGPSEADPMTGILRSLSRAGEKG